MTTRAAISPELADVIAYLAQRAENAATMAATHLAFEDAARDRKQQIEVMIDELRAGLHEGSAEVRARLLAEREARTDG